MNVYKSYGATKALAGVSCAYPRPIPLATLVGMAGLGECAGRKVDGLSGGQAQRVRFALAVADDQVKRSSVAHRRA